MEVLYLIIEADSIEQYGRGEIVRIFDVEEKSRDGVFAKVVSVTEKAGVVISSKDVTTCHRLARGGNAQNGCLPSFSDVILKISWWRKRGVKKY